mmetsp:Transcript_11729/g.30651  ORF Transcript_11729/g.30651 Transcript_11729/m.30651 type:complete len:353 (+) Transcript_11729:141-1199(+)
MAENVKENTTPLKTPATLSRRRSAEKGPAAVYEGSGSQRRRESRFRGTNQLIVPESVNADADPYRFLPKPAPRAAKAAVTAPRAEDAAAEEPRGRLSFGAAAPPAPVSEPVSEPPTAPAPAPAGRPSTGAFSDLGEDAAARSPSDLGAVARDDDAAPPPPPQLPRVTTSEKTPEEPAVWDSSHLQRAPSSGDADAFGCVGDLAAVFSDDAADTPARRVSKTGYLRKRGRMNPAWKTRWCEAWPDEGRLYYFREYNEKKCRGYIDCTKATICESLDDGSFSDCDDFTSRPTAPYAFRVRTPGGKHGEEWMLQAASAAERDAWIQCLRGMMGAAAAPRRASIKAPREENNCALM